MTPDPEESKAQRPAAQPDDMLDKSEVSRDTQKVELDLEDAPFLEDEEEPAPEPTPEPEAAPELTPETKKAPPGRKKLILIGAAALLALVVVVVVAKLLFFHGPAQAPAKKKAAPPAQPPVAAAPAKKAEVQVLLAPFWVEQKYGPDDIRFLVVQMRLGSPDAGAATEVQAKILPVRNAIFYYLKNKDVHFLADNGNMDKMRRELLLVVNQYITAGKFDSLFFQQYVVR